ncbi:FHA domain-containing protein [Cesiribacter sp. SM1]|uniref:FHA domain-containing protein n=1 Tax=Cesiribacter sp. SM1 TaxID=2861196 RepID=UPI001CD5BF91|nr:FHA domain-containing protein [Cesiribacter sp. SM1]
MLPLKYKFVNWVDGMKISKDHFIALENAVIDRFRDAVGYQLNSLNYGILPATAGSKQPLEIFFSYDHATRKITLKLLSCFAVTPAGARVEIYDEGIPGFDMGNSQPALEFEVDGFNTLGYEVVLVVNPFARLAFGYPNPEESPLRNPFIQAAHSLEVIPYPRVNQPEQGPYHLTIGRIEFEAGQPKLSKQYIPPCATIKSSSHLTSLNNRIIKKIDELEATLLKIIQKKRSGSQQTDLDQETCYVAEKVLYFLVTSKDHYKLTSEFEPPHVIVDYNLKLARVLYTALECSRNKFELLDYYCNWLEWNPGRFESTLNDSLQIKYNHQESFKALKQAEDSYELILSFFEQVWKMAAPGKGQKKLTRVFGWLVEHSREKRMEHSQVFKLDKETNIIGRGTEPAINLRIAGDQFVSRQHAQLFIDDGAFLLTDLQSSYGTMVQNKNGGWIRVNNEGFYLMDGDQIQVGKTLLVFRSQQAVSTEAEAIESVERLPYASLYELMGV